MQLEDARTIQPTTVANSNDLLYIAPVAARQPKTIKVLDLLQSAVSDLPTSNPGIAGALYLNAGVLTVSAG